MTSRRTSIGEQFAPHTISMLRSPAWRTLTLSARRVLDRIEIELADHGGTDNGKLPVTYDDFVRYGVHRHAIAPAIREVVALGFVEITEPGRAGNADWRKPNLFRLTRPRPGGGIVIISSRSGDVAEASYECPHTPFVSANLVAESTDRDHRPCDGLDVLFRISTRQIGGRNEPLPSSGWNYCARPLKRGRCAAPTRTTSMRP